MKFRECLDQSSESFRKLIFLIISKCSFNEPVPILLNLLYNIYKHLAPTNT